MSVQASVRSYVGIAKEVTKGTPVAPTDFIPVLASSLKPVDVIMPLYDQGLRGSNVNSYAYIPGRTHSTVDLGGDVFPDTIGYSLAGVMGEVTTTGASAPYTHTIALKNTATVGADSQPTAYTLTDYYAANVRAYGGQQFHDFVLTFNAEGLLSYTAKSTGWLSATASTPTPSFSTILPTPVWQGTVSIGGSSVSTALSGTITMARPATPSAVQVQATMTKGSYVVTGIDRSKDFVTIKCDINAQANTTDKGTVGYSPIKWVLQNAKPSGTYA